MSDTQLVKLCQMSLFKMTPRISCDLRFVLDVLFQWFSFQGVSSSFFSNALQWWSGFLLPSSCHIWSAPIMGWIADNILSFEQKNLQFGHIHFTIRTNTFDDLDKYIWWFGQIHLTIWTNTLDNLDNSIFQYGDQVFFWALAIFDLVSSWGGLQTSVESKLDGEHFSSHLSSTYFFWCTICGSTN